MAYGPLSSASSRQQCQYYACVQVVVLYVEMEESVRRQMLRATMAAQHNKRAADAGSEDIWNVRTTDIDDKKCRRRYEVFRVRNCLPCAVVLRLHKLTWKTLQSACDTNQHVISCAHQCADLCHSRIGTL